jgi:hypothetical protein
VEIYHVKPENLYLLSGPALEEVNHGAANNWNFNCKLDRELVPSLGCLSVMSLEYGSGTAKVLADYIVG